MDTNTLYLIASAILAAYEVLARVIPTEGNWSIIHNIVRVLDFFVKNRTVVENVNFTVTTKQEITNE